MKLIEQPDRAEGEPARLRHRRLRLDAALPRGDGEHRAEGLVRRVPPIKCDVAAAVGGILVDESTLFDSTRQADSGSFDGGASTE